MKPSMAFNKSGFKTLTFDTVNEYLVVVVFFWRPFERNFMILTICNGEKTGPLACCQLILSFKLTSDLIAFVSQITYLYEWSKA